MKKLILSVLAMSLLAWDCAYASEETLSNGYSAPRTQTYSIKDMLKNWALSRCIGAITKDKATRDDAYATAGAYFEFAVYPLETFHELDGVVNKYVLKKYSGLMPSEFNTMKCIDMYHGKELESVVTEWTTLSPSQQRKTPPGK